MGDETIHAATVEQEDEATQENFVASYTAVICSGPKLPEQYRNLIYSKWMRSNKFGNDTWREADSGPYYEWHWRYINGVLSNPESIVILAVLTDDRDVVLGFSVSRGATLDYVHVHEHNRRLGIARWLVPKNIETFTHLTKTGKTIWKSKCKHWKFNPFS